MQLGTVRTLGECESRKSIVINPSSYFRYDFVTLIGCIQASHFNIFAKVIQPAEQSQNLPSDEMQNV